MLGTQSGATDLGDDIQGLAGDDTIDGGKGDDTIDGGDDADVIYDAEGQDALHGGNGNDTSCSTMPMPTSMAMAAMTPSSVRPPADQSCQRYD